MRNPTPAPIVIPVAGTPTCRGIALTVRTLLDWTRDDDGYHLRADPCDKVLILARRAERDGAVLCLRPTNDGKGACVGMTPTAFAVASLADDFAARALVVDPYSAYAAARIAHSVSRLAQEFWTRWLDRYSDRA